ncbi:ABC transporter permease subunit [Kribbella sp. NPDC050281]|uniref:ABC transporter permease subunit n=1 Tax=Kribbella sp. NPDC050281 TaxID=3155515 RepID=UPI0033E3F39E
MVRLTTVELRRLVARRMTVVGVIGLLLITLLLLFATWLEARPSSAEEQRAAQSQYEIAHQQWVDGHVANEAACNEQWEKQPDPKPKREDMCSYPEPKPEEFGRPPTVFAELMPELLHGVSYLLLFAAFLLGASFVAAEFSTGAIGNWLTFEPRRLQVYGSKLLAAAIGFVPVAVVVLGVLVVGTYLIVDQLGSTATTTGKVWGDLLATAGRAVVLTALGAAIGGVVGLLLRHTAAAIGLAMGYLVLVEAIFGNLLNKVQPWLVKLNFDAFIRHDTTYYVNQCSSTSDGGYLCNSVLKTLTFERGAWYLGILAVILVVFGAAVFHRRDINS